MKRHIPRDLTERLELPWILDMVLKIALKIVKWFNLYKYPFIHDPDKATVKRGVYGVWKSMHPVRNPIKGSGLKEYFAGQDYDYGALLLNYDKFKVKNEIEISAVGDLMNNLGIKYSKDKFYEKIHEKIFACDLSIANLESYLTKQPIEDVKYDHRGGPKINSKFEEYQALTHHKGKKYDALCLCNNHVFDCGEEGFNTTLKQIEKDGIEYFGVNKTPEDAEKALIIEKNGIKLGLIGFTYGINNRKIPQGRDYMVNMVRFHNEGFDGDLSPIQRQITYCHEHDVDFIILTLHWGLEYEFYPTPQQVKYAHDLVEMGADLIISHHTHCIQPIEIYYPERDKHRAVPIFYGLGNISSNKSAAHVVLNLLANITLIQGTFSENTNSNSPQKNEKVITLVKKFNITPLFQLEKEINGGWYVQAQVLENMLTKDVSDKDFRDYVTKMKEYADQVLGDHRNG